MNENRPPESSPAHAASSRLAEATAWTPLGRFPTPTQSAPVLAEALGIGHAEIKRDDLSHAVYGGNKVRKLEFLLADASRRGSGAVLTFGGAGSNHALATSIHAAALGMPCYAVLTTQQPSPKVARTLRYHCRIGTRMVFGGDSFKTQRPAAAQVHEQWRGPAPLYEIAMGGTDRLGILGYLLAAYELREQLLEKGALPPTRIYVPCGTMGTVIGLALGLKMAGLDTTVVAVRVVNFTVAGPERARSLIDDTLAWLAEIDPSIAPPVDVVSAIEFRDDQFGEGYAIPTEAGEEAGELARDLAEIELDQTYSAKAFAALVADARAGRLESERAMFWNTYNSAPYPDDLADVDTSAVPEPLRYCLDG